MTAFEIIKSKIERIPPGRIFTNSDFSTEKIAKEAITRALSRITKLGEIKRFAKGNYYKPKKTIFGNL